jgi:hypothetical protein
LKTMISRKYSFQKLTQFSQGINLLDVSGSNINSFFWEMQEFIQLSWIALFARKCPFLQLENHDLQEVFF